MKLLQLKRYTDQRRNIHHTGKNRSVRIRRAVNGDKSKDLILIHLYRFTRRQIIRNNNGRFQLTPVHLFLSGKVTDQPVRNIPDICRACLHILIIHVGKHFGKIITGNCYCILRIHFLILDQIVYGILIIFILKHHLMNLEDCRIDFSDLLHGLLIQLPKLAYRLLLGLLKTLQLFFHMIYMYSFDEVISFLQNMDRTDCDSLIYGFSNIFFHFSPSHVIYRILFYRFSWKNFSIAS